MRSWRKALASVLGLKPAKENPEAGNTLVGVPKDCEVKICGTGNRVVFCDPVDEMFTGTVCIGVPNCPAFGCTVEVGGGCTSNGVTIRLMEDGSSCRIGRDCMFSDQVRIMVTDTHAITDEGGALINRGRFVTIGDHVWIGHGASILKNTTIPDGCIIGAETVVAGNKFATPRSVLVGNPAAVVKTGVTWHRERPNQLMGKVVNRQSNLPETVS